jgi:hypothetical protein
LRKYSALHRVRSSLLNLRWCTVSGDTNDVEEDGPRADEEAGAGGLPPCALYASRCAFQYADLCVALQCSLHSLHLAALMSQT